MSRREKRKLGKAEREARRLKKDAQELDDLVKDTAAAFRSSHEIVEDAATESGRRRADLDADLKYRRLAHEVWRGRPGAEPIAAAMADLIAENERHLAAIEQLCQRFDELSRHPPCQLDLDAADVPEALVRQRLFSDPPA